MFVAFLATAFAAGQTHADVGPEFSKVLAVARLDADCASGCIARPMLSQLELDEAMARATWRIETPTSYIAAFHSSLAKYLLDQKLRPVIDPKFTQADYRVFQVALNALPPYYSCLENQMRAAADAAFVNGHTIDQLANEADAKCAEPKAAAFRLIGYKGPDFHRYDPLADGGTEGGDIAEVLQQVQQFVVAYNSGLRGVTSRNAINTVLLPRSIPVP